ncbi:hypothetical protein [Nesterenkonia alkaliphila]|uniref:Uncharacterized protein n=1 Tax=Nesterenkonia alkaliphila TaxID=1463631 RepID=A0A7K1UKQ0_9MICC|nr:hypothetical protein [Nesterenkonia alkaliphila]MVT27063.1 hypothetical protein [Nesterenkonia alkaliphila]GFZ98975.1 hypothetical protein GCM10011359_30030 [Nesterenkonia alkaliphila]
MSETCALHRSPRDESEHIEAFENVGIVVIDAGHPYGDGCSDAAEWAVNDPCPCRVTAHPITEGG